MEEVEVQLLLFRFPQMEDKEEVDQMSLKAIELEGMAALAGVVADL